MSRKVFLLVAVIAALVAPSVARAETITGRFQYADTDPVTNIVTLRPIADARVEIHRYRPRAAGIWSWGHDATTTTNLDGRISIPMDFVAPGVVYGVKVFATNRGAIVWPNDVLHTVPFHREPGEPDGRIINRVANTERDVLDFSYAFRDQWSAQHYNIAETIRRGFTFITSRRDPRDTDFLPPAAVQPTSVTNSWYNPVADTVIITSGDVFSDFLILHEYAHFVEQHIGMFLPLPTVHNGCSADLLGFNMTFAGHAWMEGFADWFAAAVSVDAIGNGLTGFGIVGQTFFPQTLETPPPCSVLPRGDRIELRVAGALWDATDTEADIATTIEQHDRLNRMSTHIIRIFDHELDPPDAQTRIAPNVHQFRTAWIQRGLPACALGRIYERLSIPFIRNFAPIANAGPSRRVAPRGLVQLDGRASCDPELRPLTFQWTQIAGPEVTIRNARTPQASFTAPAQPARLTFRLTVSDSLFSDSDTVVVTVLT